MHSLIINEFTCNLYVKYSHAKLYVTSTWHNLIIIIIIKVFIESKDKNTYLMLQAIKIKNDLQY